MRKSIVIISFAILILTIFSASVNAYVHLSVKGTNVNVRAEANARGKVLTKLNNGDTFIAADVPVKNTADGSSWYKIIMSAGKTYIPLAADKRFGVANAYINANFVNVRKLNENEERATAVILADDALPEISDPDDILDEIQRRAGSPKTLPDMNTEEGISEYLAGEWNFQNTSDRKYISCRMVIDVNLNAKLEFYGYHTDKGKEVKRVFTGKISFGRLEGAPHESPPDWLHLELNQESEQVGGDYYFLHRTVYDKRCVMSLFYAGNSECLFGLLDPSVGATGNCWEGDFPDEIVFIKETGEEYHHSPRTNEEFYALFWGQGKDGVIWLDDISWPPSALPDLSLLFEGDRTYIYYTTKFDNETPVSIAYGAARDMKTDGGGKLRQGETYLINTNGRGEITKIKNVYAPTKLMYAAAMSKPLEIAAFIKNVPDLSVRDAKGRTALMFAANNNNSEAVNVLFQAGIDINATDNDGWTALMYAVDNTENPEVIPFLLKNGADAKAKDINGKRAIDYASLYNESYKSSESYKELEAASR